MSLLLLFNQFVGGTSQLGTRARFYLLTESPDPEWSSFVLLPGEVVYEGDAYLLMLGHFDANTNDLVVDAQPQPASWTGTVGQARQLLREHDLIPWWWLFDWFLAANGVEDAADFRNL